ncbi:MAG: MBL fold metallo-hydrolase [Firmicutes bacterium]|nr:MBL fold metallo-hydrolase [Bacillota bacterium]
MRTRWLSILMAVIILATTLTGCAVEVFIDTPRAPLTVHVLDVGQADSILVQTAKKSMLIDGGNRADADGIMDYLRSQGVKELDVVVATHPHTDHIGGLVDIVKDFPVAQVYMPRVAHTSKTYEDLLINIKNAGLKITPVKPGLTVELDSGIEAVFLAPARSDYDNLNNYSAVLRLGFQNTSFLFSGDAEAEAEEEMLASGFDLSSTVLKVGHHGSNTSTTSEFLAAVNPEVAVISVGADNSYGHPSEQVLKRLEEADIRVFRTDIHGVITISSDGLKLTVLTDRS